MKLTSWILNELFMQLCQLMFTCLGKQQNIVCFIQTGKRYIAPLRNRANNNKIESRSEDVGASASISASRIYFYENWHKTGLCRAGQRAGPARPHARTFTAYRFLRRRLSEILPAVITFYMHTWHCRKWRRTCGYLELILPTKHKGY